MIEDSGFISKNKPHIKAPGVEQGFSIDERRYDLDLSGSLGQGMLSTEALRNAPGLSPLHLDNEPQKAPQRTLRTQSPVLTNFSVFAPYAMRITKERETNGR